MNKLITYGGALAGDVVSALVPGGSTISKIVDAYAEKKKAEAADMLIGEVSRGYHGEIEFDTHDIDPLIEIIYRFWKAVEAGAARENLRLLAQVIGGLKKNKALDDTDQFRKWSNILESLTRDELIVLGKAVQIRRMIISSGPSAANDFWQQLESSLESGGYSKSEVTALCAAITRTGLLTGGSAFGGLVYMDTPWLMQLGKLADLEGILRE